MESVRVPLFTLPSQRQFSTSEDQWFKNCYPEQIDMPGTDKPTTHIVKRPGFSDSLTTSPAVTVTDFANIAVGTTLILTKADGTTVTFTSEAVSGASPAETLGFRPNESNDTTADNIFTAVNAHADFTVANPDANAVIIVGAVSIVSSDTTRLAVSAAGRALYGWTQDGKIYAVIGNKIFRDGSALSGTLDDTTGRVDVTEVRGGTPRLVFRVSDKIWTVAEDGTMTKQTDADIPTGLVSGIVNINGYIFVMKGATNQIFHSDNNDPTSWNSANNITSSLEPDLGVGVAKHLNYIVAFNEWSTEFFFDAGNASGSVLSPVEGIAMRYGCANGDTIFSGENTVIWMAQGRTGGKSIMMLDGNDLKTLSTKSIERLIDEEANGGGNGLADAYAYGMRIAGHQLYILTLKNTAKTLVCDLRDQTWSQWTSFDGTNETYFTGMDFCEDADKKFILDEDNGKIYNMDIDIHQDSSQDIKVEVLTDRFDFTTTKPKFLYRLGVIGDIETSSSTLTIDWSDDDYNTYGTSRTVDMSDTFPRLVSLGRFHRRAFRLAHAANTPLRISALEFGLDLGNYSEGNN